MKKNIFFTVILFGVFFSFATMAQEKNAGEPSHEKFNSLLQKYVSATGAVNYTGLKTDKAVLENYLNELAKEIPNEAWTKNSSLAYWINAYNAFTLKLIIDNYPVKSITVLKGGKPWDAKWIQLATKRYSLNNIENDIIRPQFKDPRIHFALNCAAISCPPLLNRAYTGENVNELLSTLTKNFINSKSNDLSSSKKIMLSKIFDWYKADFGDVVSFLNKYSNTKVEKKVSVNYYDYNWNLNE